MDMNTSKLSRIRDWRKMRKPFHRILWVALLVSACTVRFSRADESVVARWDFGAESTNVFSTFGSVLRDQAGPRPPEFPDFEQNNTALKLEKNGAHLAIVDPGTDSKFDFTNGDPITLEAWVKLDSALGNAGSGSPVYVIGKGRTGNPRVARDNQNWAMRLMPANGQAKIGFLFATQPSSGEAHWHRWTSNSMFALADGWHHVAVAYRFGEPDSIRGWIDGKPSDGNWDMGGKTTEPPIVDNDDVWIGSANTNNSFVGFLDAIAIHREIVKDQFIANRFHRVAGPAVAVPSVEVMPSLGSIPKNRVLVTFTDGLAKADRWLNEGEAWPNETARWIGDEFLMPRLPRRYDDWGIRDDWKGPLLMRMAADVELKPGIHQFLLRARGLGRLWVDGKQVAQTKAYTRKSPDGEQPITPVAEPPSPGLRAPGYHQQEVIGESEILPLEGHEVRLSRVVLELVIGGSGQRTETGEVCVAVKSETSIAWEILSPQRSERLPLTDLAVEGALKRIETYLSAYDDDSRRRASNSQAAFWNRRHQAAREWVASSPKRFPDSAVNTSPPHPIDAFIASKISKAVAAAATTSSSVSENFYQQVLPILREQCFRCHGEKEKGGLKLNSRESALRAGESEVTAVVPGHPELSELIAQVRSGAMPPTGNGLSADQITTLEMWIRDGAVWPAPPVSTEQIATAPAIDDASFLRRLYLDTVGVPPTAPETRSFLQDNRVDKRERLIDRLLADDRIADNWISYWQDILAENPTLLNQSMGSTGPFRWFLHDSLRDNKAIDRMITELIMMRGSPATGGSAAFALAGESDAPFAAKSHIVAAAFLGIELQCARCHDSPYHRTTQRDLYALAAMLERKSVKVPSTSRVPDAFFQKKGRDSLIKVTLKPDELVDPTWPFAETTGIHDNEQLHPFMSNPGDTRERLATLITAPQNLRFGRVIVNRIWKKLIGTGLVEPVDDWEGRTPSHPELLDWLVQELVAHDYDLRHLMRQIMTSKVYSLAAKGSNMTASAEQRFFNAPDRRRLSAEQVVDSLYLVTGNKMDVEELTFVHDGQRPLEKRQTLGCPQRAWMFASLNNERDRPSLSLPKARSIVDVLEAFGWNGARQKPVSVRDSEPNVLQPGILSNGTLALTLTRAAYQSELAQLAIHAESPSYLVDEWFLRVLCRFPLPNEREAFANALSVGFESRLNPSAKVSFPEPASPLPLVTWFNHLQPETNTIQQERERRVTQGPPPDPRLESTWRATYEDFVWSLINHRDFVWLP